MNVSLSSQIGFRCRVVRASRVLWGGAGHQHTLACAHCQAFFQTTDALDQELRRAAVAFRGAAPAPSPELSRSILRAAREEAVTAGPDRFRVPVWAMSAAAVAAILVAGAFMQKPDHPTRAPTAMADDAEVIVTAVERLSVKLTDTVIPVTGEMLANNPLQQELGSVYSDARSALDFLALNFLPTAPRREPSKPVGTI